MSSFILSAQLPSQVALSGGLPTLGGTLPGIYTSWGGPGGYPVCTGENCHRPAGMSNGISGEVAMCETQGCGKSSLQDVMCHAKTLGPEHKWVRAALLAPNGHGRASWLGAPDTFVVQYRV